jgi:hypothetical protein
MRDFEGPDDYDDWVTEIASGFGMPTEAQIHNAAEMCITAVAHVGDEVTLLGAADPWTKLRAYPDDVLRLTNQEYNQFPEVDGYRDLAVACLREDIRERL